MAKYSEKFCFAIHTEFMQTEQVCEEIRYWIDGFFCLPKEQKNISFFVKEGKEVCETYMSNLSNDYLSGKIRSRKEFKIRVVGLMNYRTLRETRDEYVFVFRAYQKKVVCGCDLIVE